MGLLLSEFEDPNKQLLPQPPKSSSKKTGSILLSILGAILLGLAAIAAVLVIGAIIIAIALYIICSK